MPSGLALRLLFLLCSWYHYLSMQRPRARSGRSFGSNLRFRRHYAVSFRYDATDPFSMGWLFAVMRVITSRGLKPAGSPRHLFLYRSPSLLRCPFVIIVLERSISSSPLGNPSYIVRLHFAPACCHSGSCCGGAGCCGAG